MQVNPWSNWKLDLKSFFWKYKNTYLIYLSNVRTLLMTFLFRFSLILLLKVPDRRQKMFRAAKIRATFHLFGSPSTRGSLVPLFLVVAGWYASTRIGRRVRVHAREIPDKRAGVPRLRRGFLSQKSRAFEVVGGVLRRFFVFLRLCAGPSRADTRVFRV